MYKIMKEQKSVRIGVALFFISLTTAFQAQTIAEKQPDLKSTPINMEMMLGSRGIYYQVMVNKKFKSIPKLGFFSITNGNAPWEKEMTPDIMTQSHITYTLLRGLEVTTGLQYTPVYGFRPVASLIYSYSTPEFTIVANPKIDLASDWASENMLLIEYRPKINDNWSWYGRAQGLYGFVPSSGDHNRSYIYLRAGLSYKEFSFGLGSNFEWYGPIKHNENSIGLFATVLVF